MKLTKKLKYKQPHSIKINLFNEALNYHLIIKAHHREKYLASKQHKRLYEKNN